MKNHENKRKHRQAHPQAVDGANDGVYAILPNTAME